MRITDQHWLSKLYMLDAEVMVLLSPLLFKEIVPGDSALHWTLTVTSLVVEGESKKFLILEIYKKLSYTLLLFSLFNFDVVGLIYAQIINSIISFLIFFL